MQYQLYSPKHHEKHPWQSQEFHLSVVRWLKKKKSARLNTDVLKERRIICFDDEVVRVYILYLSSKTPFLKTCTITLRDDTAGQLIILIIDTNTILCAGFQFIQLNTHWRFDHDFGGLVQSKLCHLFSTNNMLAKWGNNTLGLSCFNRHSVLIFYSFNKKLN